MAPLPLKNTLNLIATYGTKIINGTISDAEIALLCDSSLSFPRTNKLNQLQVIIDFVQMIGPYIKDDQLERLTERFLAMESLLKPNNQFMRNSMIPRVLLAFTLTRTGKATDNPTFAPEHPIYKHFKWRAVEQNFEEEIALRRNEFVSKHNIIKRSDVLPDEQYALLNSLQNTYISECEELYKTTLQQHCGAFFEIDIDPLSDYTLTTQKMKLSNLGTRDTVILYQDELHYLHRQNQCVEKLNIKKNELAKILKQKCKIAHVANASEVQLIREASGYEQTVQNKIDISIQNIIKNIAVVITLNYQHFKDIEKSQDPLVLLALAISKMPQEDAELRKKMIMLMGTAQQLLAIEQDNEVREAVQSALEILTKKISSKFNDEQYKDHMLRIKELLTTHLTIESAVELDDDTQIKKGLIEQFLELLTWVWEALFGKKQLESVPTEPTEQNDYKLRFLEFCAQVVDHKADKNTSNPEEETKASDRPRRNTI